MTPVLQFKPIYQERVWGGRELETFLGRKLPGTTPIGESWEIVDRTEAQSVIANGKWAGKTLRAAIEADSADIMGPSWPKARSFPILVKWLDCRDRLSVQVHPPASIAAKLGGEPKTENWYFAQVDQGAAVYAGLKPGVTRATFEQGIADGTVAKQLESLPVKNGDSLLIHSGTMHAIDAGNVILEIQQNSDTTYRVYDWGRVGLDGKPRALHVEQSLACLDANTSPEPKLLHQSGVLVDAHEFRLTKYELKTGEHLKFPAGEPRILSVTTGVISGNGAKLTLGANVILQHAGDYSFTAEEDATVLIADRFNHPL
ncbi:type I phosphomannose isomerase catalytic subunit [Oleiharenicola lentus]|uniref:type I phosphomannose isomerase catalytic subunit n=1 Tax=Oleiharenicola lentus TaxID=2508720 RepID=UPI003F675678